MAPANIFGKADEEPIVRAPAEAPEQETAQTVNS